MEGPLMSHFVSLPSEAEATPNVPVNLLETVVLLNKHLTESLCEQVFQSNRTTEREREWSLFALGRFWTAVAIQGPESLGQAFAQARAGLNGLLPEVTTTDGGSFQRFKTFHWRFFHALYYAFTQRLLGEAQPVFAGQALPEARRGIFQHGRRRTSAARRSSAQRWSERSRAQPRRPASGAHDPASDPRQETWRSSSKKVFRSRQETLEVVGSC